MFFLGRQLGGGGFFLLATGDFFQLGDRFCKFFGLLNLNVSNPHQDQHRHFIKCINYPKELNFCYRSANSYKLLAHSVYEPIFKALATVPQSKPVSLATQEFF